jgi:hypothetical protein
MKALSVRQPHASRIARGIKTLEIRSWKTHYRGPLLICAAARAITRRERTAHGIEDPAGYPLGVALCIVQLVGCRPMTQADVAAACTNYEPGVYAWELINVQGVEAFKVDGQLGLFTVILDHTPLARQTDINSREGAYAIQPSR